MYLTGESCSALPTSVHWIIIFKTFISTSYCHLFEEHSFTKSSEPTQEDLSLLAVVSYPSAPSHHPLVSTPHTSWYASTAYFVLILVPLSKPPVRKFNSLRWQKVKWAAKKKRKGLLPVKWVKYSKYSRVFGKFLIQWKWKAICIGCRGEDRK